MVVQTLGIMEMTSVSWINICAVGAKYLVHFVIALHLPFLDSKLPKEFRTGRVRMWPDQQRMIESVVPIEHQITELHLAHILGNLAWVKLSAVEDDASALWIIRTHAGSNEERTNWIRSVIALEGRLAGA